MVNPQIKAFMEAQGFEALTFNDVSMETRYADFLPAEASIVSQFSRNITLNAPFVSAAMDTVTESGMAIEMAKLGGIGVIHKNLQPAVQAEQAAKVKQYLHGLIQKPIVFHQNLKVADLLRTKDEQHYTFSGFPIVDDSDRLVGILTSRDVKYLTDYNITVADAMTRNLVVGTANTDMTEAFEIMRKNKVGKLPIVDREGRLCGLYSFHDVRTLLKNIEPNYNRDARHRLRVAAAVGPYDDERIAALVAAEVDALVLDTAHGYSKGVIETLKQLKKDYPQVDVVAGNVCTAEGAAALYEAGADGVKVGIGPGSICTTRVVAGVGIPQLTAVFQANEAIKDRIPIIADGGIAHSGDVAKAIAVGASCVMMGSALAGTEECPGERILHQGRTYVIYRGMGSLDAMRKGKGSRERYGVSAECATEKLVPQGIEGMIPYRGSVSEVLNQYIGGLRFSLGYCGARTIAALQENARFVRVSSAGLHEAHPHDVIVQKDAPNYRAT
ncbi:IMP dehydrogenase [Oligosphaera ethanolica]|mgnify:FL=1|uniref:Inosine-5'-monophosphate dehydrogenase n=1 Tax=Oligosphaera ethanolica TaxID=760260 RepID=A0AAE3VEL6_9BACT|nr:IMP dehydrogenase [Oligosphaera ethanolica]MDQ0288991.1 IMP dehydrogenase [Oligosphaera ethanolica]